MTLTGQVAVIHSRKGWHGRLVQTVIRSHWNHNVTAISDTECVSAEPGGAIIRPIAYYDDQEIVWSRFELSTRDRHLITQEARTHIGVPYGWGDFIAAGIASLTGRATPDWLRAIVANDGRLICSQAADLALQAAGIRLFANNPDGAITPATFGNVFVQHGWTDKG